MTIKTRLTTVGQVLGEQVKITTDNQLVVNLKYKVIFKTFHFNGGNQTSKNTLLL